MLVNTLRNRIIVFQVEPGEYIHFDVETEIVKSLLNLLFVYVDILDFDFHTDGCSLDRSSNIYIWPIQCKVANIPNTQPVVVGIYRGKH